MAQKQKVLIVEDEFILYDQLVDFFETKGYEVVKHSDEKAVDNYDDAIQLIKQQQPDIAILDIRIKGQKDGIDVGYYIKQHYNIPVIYLSAYPTPGNLERLRTMGEERFVFKATKPLQEEQLWSVFFLALSKIDAGIKQKTIGHLFKAKEIDVARLRSKDAAIYDPLELKIFINWDDIMYVESYNASTADGNNNLLFHLQNGKAYVIRHTMIAAEAGFPDYFARLNQSAIVNLKHISAVGKDDTFCLIREQSFPITEKYRKKALEKINLYLSSRF